MCSLISLLANWLNFKMLIRNEGRSRLIIVNRASVDQRSQFSLLFCVCVFINVVKSHFSAISPQE